MRKIGNIEILLIQIIIYLIIYFINDYIATMMSIIFICVITLILFISFVSELIERSKVPRSYFILMFLSILAPILSSAIYFGVNGGFSWLANN